MTKSPPAFPTEIAVGFVPSDAPEIVKQWCQSRKVPTNGISQRLYIATKLAAGDIQWIKAMGKDELIKRITIYYRIADALIAGEHATEGKEKEG